MDQWKFLVDPKTILRGFEGRYLRQLDEMGGNLILIDIFGFLSQINIDSLDDRRFD